MSLRTDTLRTAAAAVLMWPIACATQPAESSHWRIVERVHTASEDENFKFSETSAMGTSINSPYAINLSCNGAWGFPMLALGVGDPDEEYGALHLEPGTMEFRVGDGWTAPAMSYGVPKNDIQSGKAWTFTVREEVIIDFVDMVRRASPETEMYFRARSSTTSHHVRVPLEGAVEVIDHVVKECSDESLTSR